MCGIVFDARSHGGDVSVERLETMVKRLARRGPDGQRTWISERGDIGLAHARLTIVDLTERGNQPMTNEDGSLWLTCNGEVYNHEALRRTLEAAGHRFYSRSDNEVLLHGYEEWGLGVLERVRGMFAFAIAEPAAGRVIAARDRIGEKPLVFVEDDLGVVAASEIPALLAGGRVGTEIDPRALAYFLARNLRHVPEPLSLFADVQKLPPAQAIVVEAGRLVSREFWWRPTWRGPRTSCSAFLRDVADAVDLQARADVEVGALLSGGVDSSIVVGLTAQRKAPPRSYALGRDEDDEELRRARAAASRFGCELKEATFHAAQLSRLDALIEHLGEPIALLPVTHADALMSLASADGLRVVVTGNGADELLWGYHGVPRLRAASALMRLTDLVPRRALAALAALPLPAGARLGLRLAAFPVQRRKLELYRAAVADSAELLRPEFRDAARMPEECPVFGPWSELFDGRDFIELSQFLSLVVEDAHSVTLGADLAGMHHSVEARAPFLDAAVVEGALRLSKRDKAGPVWRPEGKHVLKRGFRSLIGERVATAGKMGFGYGLQESDLIRGPLREAIADRVLGGDGVARFFDREAVKHRFADHVDGRSDHGKFLLSLYAFDAWYDTFVTRRVTA